MGAMSIPTTAHGLCNWVGYKTYRTTYSPETGTTAHVTGIHGGDITVSMYPQGAWCARCNHTGVVFAPTGGIANTRGEALAIITNAMRHSTRAGRAIARDAVIEEMVDLI